MLFSIYHLQEQRYCKHHRELGRLFVSSTQDKAEITATTEEGRHFRDRQESVQLFRRLTTDIAVVAIVTYLIEIIITFIVYSIFDLRASMIQPLGVSEAGLFLCSLSLVNSFNLIISLFVHILW